MIECTFGKETCRCEGLQSIRKGMSLEEKVQLLELWMKVKCALRGRTVAPYEELVWLASVGVNGTVSVHQGT